MDEPLDISNCISQVPVKLFRQDHPFQRGIEPSKITRLISS